MFDSLSRNIFILSLCAGVHFAAVTFLLPLLHILGDGSPWFESVFYAAHIVALPFLGRLADRCGARRVLTISLIGELLAFGLLTVSWERDVLLVARLLSGASSAILPVCFSWIRRHTEDERQLSRGVAAIMLGITVGGGSGALISGFLGDDLNIAVPIMIAGNALALLLMLTLPRSQPPFASLPTTNHPSTPSLIKEGELAAQNPVSRVGTHDRSPEVIPPLPSNFQSPVDENFGGNGLVRSRDTTSSKWLRLSSPLLSMAFVFLTVSTGFFLFRSLLSFRFEKVSEAGLALAFLSLGIGIAQLTLFLRPVSADRALKSYLVCITLIVVSFIFGMQVSGTFFLVSLVLLGPSIGAADVLGGTALAHVTASKNAGASSGTVFGIGALGKIAGPSLAALFSATLPIGLFLPILFGLAGLLILLQLVRRT